MPATTSSGEPPKTWRELPFRRPAENAKPGAIYRTAPGRVFVRSYDTYNATNVLLGDDEDRYDMWSYPLWENTDDPHVVVGDVVVGLGTVQGDDAVNLWTPERLVWMGDRGPKAVRVRTLADVDCSPRTMDEACIPLHLLTEEEDAAVKELALTAEAADRAKAEIVFAIFDCADALPKSYR